MSTLEISRVLKELLVLLSVRKDGICFPYKLLHCRMSGSSFANLYYSRKCLDVVKGTVVESYYTNVSKRLALMCAECFRESDEVGKYVGGLPDMIQGKCGWRLSNKKNAGCN
ncbi:hypothetical protein Tco_0513424 [Tanacetum coccineum]